MTVHLVECTFAHGQNRYRVNSGGEWQTLMFGWWPTGNNPRWKWEPIPADKVPSEVRGAA